MIPVFSIKCCFMTLVIDYSSGALLNSFFTCYWIYVLPTRGHSTWQDAPQHHRQQRAEGSSAKSASFWVKRSGSFAICIGEKCCDLGENAEGLGRFRLYFGVVMW